MSFSCHLSHPVLFQERIKHLQGVIYITQEEVEKNKKLSVCLVLQLMCCVCYIYKVKYS